MKDALQGITVIELGTVLTAPKKASATQGTKPTKTAPDVLTTPTGMQPLGGVGQ